MTKLLVARSGNWVKSGQAPVPFATANARDQLVLGQYKPGPTTTGVLPGVPRTTVTAASQLPGGGIIGGSTYVNYNFQFFVTPPTGTTKITFRNCLFQGNPTNIGSFVGLTKVYNPGHCPVDFFDCTFLPQRLSRFWNGVHGHDFRVFRCDISYVIDAFSVFTGPDPAAALNAEVYQSWIHDHVWWDFGTGDIGEPNNPAAGNRENSSDGSHNDGVQLQSGAGFTFRGNYLSSHNAPEFFNTRYGDDYANTGLILQDNVGTSTGVVITDNWLGGGAATINVTGQLRNLGTIKRNIFAVKDSALNSDSRESKFFLRNPGHTIDTGTNGVDGNVKDTFPASLTTYNASRPPITFTNGA